MWFAMTVFVSVIFHLLFSSRIFLGYVGMCGMDGRFSGSLVLIWRPINNSAGDFPVLEWGVDR